ncbi:uncharacterized protein LOC134531000 isoform X3 [Bacillus rossius redtenbacheri]|uniref:uncharacterized protein LOC134531000 isoform X3 n=1 Tax=Bacillus rossius redtenbacheri TaxID=93214 RepID=UPI002FDDD364
MPKMMLHVNTKRIQHDEFEKDKANGTKRVLEVDFAMSFSCEYQNEIQSALWSRASVVLFTAAVFCNGNCKTYILCSDTNNKDKDTVFVFLDFFYTEILKENSAISEEIIWSDGPSSEFKNKFMVKTLEILNQKHNRTFTWKYFATSHGKGVVDGVGGNIKRLVRMKMMTQGEGCTIQSAKDFAEVAAQLDTKSHLWYIEEDHIRNEILSQNPWRNVPSIPGIKEFHIITCSTSSGFYAKNNALSTKIALSNPKGNLFNFPGKWVVVCYEGKEYPGEVVDASGDQVQVSVMVPTGPPHHFKWPRQPDCICYLKEDVAREISPPVVVNNRGLFKFIDI